LEKRVTETNPPTFLWHTFEDGCVPVQNSLFYALALKEKNVPFEMHIYPNGHHGLSLADPETNRDGVPGTLKEVSKWPELAAAFLNRIFGE
jgi:dipeptidyl aminopeptidase/acylaminoacyl peptidase